MLTRGAKAKQAAVKKIFEARLLEVSKLSKSEKRERVQEIFDEAMRNPKAYPQLPSVLCGNKGTADAGTAVLWFDMPRHFHLDDESVCYLLSAHRSATAAHHWCKFDDLLAALPSKFEAPVQLAVGYRDDCEICHPSS
jgi:hypothetical protein